MIGLKHVPEEVEEEERIYLLCTVTGVYTIIIVLSLGYSVKGREKMCGRLTTGYGVCMYVLINLNY